MFRFPLSFFQLQVDFADAIANQYQISIEESLYKYTSLYTRVIGFSDFDPPRPDHPRWVEIINSLSNQKDLAQYFYKLYLQFEENKPVIKNGQIFFGCFSYVYDAAKKTFALHFSNNDPQGNLGRDRVEQRRTELKELFTALRNENQLDASVHVTTWLLNIEAFNRLFPLQFIATKKLRNKGTVQDNGTWGQFVDRHGNLQENLANQLRENMKEHRPIIDEYFPLPMLRAETTQQVFYDFYQI